MTRESEWQEEWAALRVEREAARRRWCGATAALAERARDPFGIRALVRAHPVATGGIVAGALAFVVNRLGRAGRAPEPPASPYAAADSTNGKDAVPPEGGPSLLRQLVLGVGLPWLLRLLDGGVRTPDAPAEAEREDPVAAG